MEKENRKNSELLRELVKAMAAEKLPFTIGHDHGRPAVKYPAAYNSVCVVIARDGGLEILGGLHTDQEKEEDAPAWPLAVAEVLRRIAAHNKLHNHNI